jgi:hypothetical protein
VLSGDQVLDKSEPEHEEMRGYIAKLRELSPEDQAFDETLMTLMRTVIHHVADEETRLLPAAERLLSDQLATLGAQMTRRRMELLAPHAREVASTGARTFPAGAATGAVIAIGSALALGAMVFSRAARNVQRGRWQH